MTRRSHAHVRAARLFGGYAAVGRLTSDDEVATGRRRGRRDERTGGRTSARVRRGRLQGNNTAPMIGQESKYAVNSKLHQSWLFISSHAMFQDTRTPPPDYFRFRGQSYGSHGLGFWPRTLSSLVGAAKLAGERVGHVRPSIATRLRASDSPAQLDRHATSIAFTAAA